MKHWIKLSTVFWLSMALYFIKVFVSIVCVNCVSSKIKLFFHCSLNPGSAVRGYSRSQGNCIIHFRCTDIFIHIYLSGATLPNSAVWQYDTIHHTCMYMHRHKICIEYIETMIWKSKYEWNCKILKTRKILLVSNTECYIFRKYCKWKDNKGIYMYSHLIP